MSADFKGRREDQRLTTGRGRYTDDWNLPGQLHAAFKRSDRAHAIIRSVSVDAARQAPGVVAVITAAEIEDAGFSSLPPIIPFPGRGGQKALVPDRPLLARGRVRFTGEEVAMVVAESRLAAQDAAELIEVDYEDLPAIISFEQALAPDAVTIHDGIPGNVCFDFEYGSEAKTDELLALAEHRVRVTLESPRVAPTPMEPRAALALYDANSETFELRCAHQGAFALRDSLSTMMNVPADKIRVNLVDVGGAFGARTAPFSEYPIMLYASKKLGRPIKWLSTRSEDFLTDRHGRALRLEGELGFDSSGKFLALKTNWLCDSGAYLALAGVLTNSANGMLIGAGVYQVPAVYGRHRQVMTNTAPTDAYRGAGRPEAVYIVERLVDAAAALLGRDPLKLRRKNAIRSDQMPYKTPTNAVIDSGDFAALIDKAREAARWDSFKARSKEAARRGAIRGIGCAVFLEPSGGGMVPKDQVAIRFVDAQHVELFSVAGPSGQGHETVFPELVANMLGIDPERVTLRAGDPDGPSLMGSPAIGSRTVLSHGSAYKIGSEQVIEKGRTLASEALEASLDDIEFGSGHYRVKGTDRSIGFSEIMALAASKNTRPLDSDAETPIGRAFPSGAHVVEIEIDRATGASRVVDYTAVDDVGNVLNHVLTEGQLHGGIVQGAGQVFGEHCAYDESTGQLVTGSFMDYTMPRADLVLNIRALTHNVPSPNNALGAKGAGEAGTVGAMAACMSAVIAALRSVGVEHFDMPATPARIWAAIQAAGTRPTP
jgi:carbon-monoxide dehydrogenase large subunit